MKVYIPYGSNSSYMRLMESLGFYYVNELKKADLVLFTGGEDVSPNLYNELKHKKTHSNPRRDALEVEVYKSALQKKLPMVGICRGGQFLNVMNGGKIYQDIEDHLGPHLIVLNSGEKFYVTSTHHQGIIPNRKEGTVIATADLQSMCETPLTNGVRICAEKVTEIVLYEKTKSLCFQPHPEFYMGMEGVNSIKYKRMYELFRELVADLMELPKGILVK